MGAGPGPSSYQARSGSLRLKEDSDLRPRRPGGTGRADGMWPLMLSGLSELNAQVNRDRDGTKGVPCQWHAASARPAGGRVVPGPHHDGDWHRSGPMPRPPSRVLAGWEARSRSLATCMPRGGASCQMPPRRVCQCCQPERAPTGCEAARGARERERRRTRTSESGGYTRGRACAAPAPVNYRPGPAGPTILRGSWRRRKRRRQVVCIGRWLARSLAGLVPSSSHIVQAAMPRHGPIMIVQG